MFDKILVQENGDVIYVKYEKTCGHPEGGKFLKASIIYYIGDERISLPMLSACDETSLHDLALKYYHNVLGR